MTDAPIKKHHIRPRSLSNTVKPISSCSLSPSLKMPPTLRSMKDASRVSNKLNSTLPQLRAEKLSKMEDVPINQFSYSLRNKLSKAKNTQSMKAPSIPNKNGPIQTVCYTIKMLSNWGCPDLIACSEIIPIDAKNHHVPVYEITASPRKVELTDLFKLVSGFESHEDLEDTWSCSWPQQTPIEINMIVPVENPLKVIRFFNANEVYKDAGVRNVEIWSDNILLWEGEIPYDFPYVAHLKRPTSNQHQNSNYEKQTFSQQHTVLPPNPMNCYVDPFGIVPQVPSESITIEFFSSYENSSAFGLSGIEIITTKKETLKLDDFKEIKVENLASAANLDTLFRGQYMIPKIDDMFVFERSNDDHFPSITVEFKKPTLVGQIRIWNFFPSCGTEDDYTTSKENKAKMGICAKNIAIKFDKDNTVFIGRINQGDGTLKRIETGLSIIFVNEMDYKFMRSTKYQNVDKINNINQVPIPIPPNHLNRQLNSFNQVPIPSFG